MVFPPSQIAIKMLQKRFFNAPKMLHFVQRFECAAPKRWLNIQHPSAHNMYLKYSQTYYPPPSSFKPFDLLQPNKLIIPKRVAPQVLKKAVNLSYYSILKYGDWQASF